MIELIFSVSFCAAIRRFTVCRLDYSHLAKSRNPQIFRAHWPRSFVLLVCLLFLFQPLFHPTLFNLRVLQLSLASPRHYLLCSDLYFFLILHSIALPISVLVLHFFSLDVQSFYICLRVECSSSCQEC